ncbi:Short-chain dehydrogenase [Psilocybe cubensis]|uniref:Short-chain dehydrogenase n=1 Tax=Psilocybe cubensis TaxID=181762 RepID=A0ACB8GP94_PSICU|nr:Short-chain dehydrogenase [Psilocybe cubensis]KAH9477399.1 Short-chain dehydrogenase [Psilocybe cubensis]
MLFSKKFDPKTDLNDLSGKVALITGANCATVKHLAVKGAKVYLGSRSEEKGIEAVQKLTDEGIAAGQVIALQCDIGTPASARQAAENFLKLENRLDILVNNAGCTYDTTDKTAANGLSIIRSFIRKLDVADVLGHFQKLTKLFSHFGTFQFTKSLLPLLIKTSEETNSDVRIVNVSSEIHRRGLGSKPFVDFSTIEPFKETYANDMVPWMSRYIVSKLAMVTFSNALQRKLSSTSIICMSIHPGTVNTTFHTHFNYPRLTNFIASIFFKGPEEGAYNSALAAASPIVRQCADKYKGAYLYPVGRIISPAPATMSTQVQDDLWETTEKYLREHP